MHTHTTHAIGSADNTSINGYYALSREHNSYQLQTLAGTCVNTVHSELMDDQQSYSRGTTRD